MSSRDSRQRRSLRLMVLALAGAVVFSGIVLIGTAASARTSNAPGAVGQAAVTAQPVRDGKFEFTLRSLNCGVKQVGQEPLTKVAQGSFCLVTLNVKNIGSQGQAFDPMSQKALTANGTKFSTDLLADTYANPNAASLVDEINPGNQIQVTLVFDVPSGTTLSKMEVHDSLLSKGATLNLG